MTTSISLRPKLGFHVSSILKMLAFASMCVLLFRGFLNSIQENAERPNDYPELVISIIFCLLFLYSIFWYYKNIITIQADSNGITFNKKTFNWTVLTDLELTGKQPFRFVTTTPREGIKLQFSDGETKYIFDHQYTNYWTLKLFLHQVVLNKESFTAYDNQPVSKSELEATSYTTYKGHPLFSLRGLSLLLPLSFLISTFSTGNFSILNPAFIIIVLFCMIWFVSYRGLMYYFRLSPNYLVVRNHLWPGKQKVYRVSYIKEIVFETKPKRPYSLRVITNDFKTQLFPGSTLSKQSWHALKYELEQYHIKVRDECQ